MNDKKLKVFIDGNQGTTGLKIFDRLSKSRDIELLQISEELRKDKAERKKLLNSADIVFLCLPDDAAKEAAALVENEDVKIIDASTAHRTEENWAYGFPELSCEAAKEIKSSRRVAVPGCHASGFLSIVYPLVKLNILPSDYPVVCHSVTGYSGGGKKMIAEYESERDESLDSPRQYALTQSHKHLKEMKTISGLKQAPIFNPIVADFERGMCVTVPIFSNLLNCTIFEVHKALSEHYHNSVLVSVMPLNVDIGGFLPANLMKGKDSMRIYVYGNEDRIVCCSVFDNLGKGASGAAIQCMNLMTGRQEFEDLDL